MVIQIDSREKSKAIQQIISYFINNGVSHYTSKLLIGDYMNLDNPRIIIDRKQNLSELCGNVCQDHKRFTAELQKAKDIGIKIVILCEHGGNIKSLDSVKDWKNPRLKTSPLAVSGERLHKILLTMSLHYGVEYVFCDKHNTGKLIVKILAEGGGGVKNGA